MKADITDLTPPVITALRAGTPLALLETAGYFSLTEEEGRAALEATEQALWQNGCIPCPVAVVEGRVKFGLTESSKSALFAAGSEPVSRGKLPLLLARGGTAALKTSAVLSLGNLVDVATVVAPDFMGELEDIEALVLTGRLLFCTELPRDVEKVLEMRSVPVLPEGGGEAAAVWSMQRRLKLTESTVCTARALEDICAAAAATALEMKKRSDWV